MRKYRVLSNNQQIQHQFVVAPKRVWMLPPQTLTTELMSYGVRTIDVNADDNLFVPGYEYHYIDDSLDPPSLYSQIPTGYAGDWHERDRSRADASPWLDKLPIIKQFKAKVLHKRDVRPRA